MQFPDSLMPMLSRLQIRTKLALVMTLLLAVMSIAIYVYFPEKLQRQAIDAMTEQARAVAEMTALSVAAPLHENDNIAVVEALPGLRRNPDLVYFTLKDASGRVVTSFHDAVEANTRVAAPALPRASASGIGTLGTPSATAGT